MASDWFDKISVAVGVVMLNSMLVIGILQVVNRYIGLPVDLYWTYTVAQTLLGLMTIVAIPYLFKNNSDISFVPVIKRITSRTDAILLIRNVAVSLLAVVLVWSAYLAYQTSGNVGLPQLDWFKIGWVYILLGVNSVVLLVMILRDTRDRIHRVREGSNYRSQEDFDV